MGTEVGRYAQSSRPDGQLRQHLCSAMKHQEEPRYQADLWA